MDVKRRFNGTEAELMIVMTNLENKLRIAGASLNSNIDLEKYGHVISVYAADLANEGLTFNEFVSMGRTYFEHIYEKKPFNTHLFKALVYTLGPVIEFVEFIKRKNKLI
ncbi:MAG: hypothetical protein Q8R00_04925 [Candidatus Nanoarchaeia archaeon]|nr:hypothetical protein [Candidatus Nanoarchaeia archaeon]